MSNVGKGDISKSIITKFGQESATHHDLTEKGLGDAITDTFAPENLHNVGPNTVPKIGGVNTHHDLEGPEGEKKIETHLDFIELAGDLNTHHTLRDFFDKNIRETEPLRSHHEFKIPPGLMEIKDQLGGGSDDVDLYKA